MALSTKVQSLIVLRSAGGDQEERWLCHSAFMWFDYTISVRNTVQNKVSPTLQCSIAVHWVKMVTKTIFTHYQQDDRDNFYEKWNGWTRYILIDMTVYKERQISSKAAAAKVTSLHFSSFLLCCTAHHLRLIFVSLSRVKYFGRYYYSYKYHSIHQPHISQVREVKKQ